jgi:hypothetical protein
MQREGIDYTETFSPVSCKYSLRIIMALVAYYDLELHQMDVKTTFLNGDMLENVYMAQPCRKRKRTYGVPSEEIHSGI